MTSYVTHPGLQKAPAPRRFVILPPRVDVLEIGAGGVIEKIDEWSQKAFENVLNAFEAELANRAGVTASRLDRSAISASLKMELEETERLFDAVSASVLQHVLGPPEFQFKEKIQTFDYSLGDETARLNMADADVFVIAKAVDQISSGARKAVQLTTIVAAAAVGVIVIPQPGVTLMNIALVDARTGDVLWFSSRRSLGGHDLRDPASASAFIKNSLADLPIP